MLAKSSNLVSQERELNGRFAFCGLAQAEGDQEHLTGRLQRSSQFGEHQI